MTTTITPELKQYVAQVRHYYSNELCMNDAAHDLEHVDKVCVRILNMRLELFPENEELDKLCVLAAYTHDLKCHINRDKHHELSALYVTNNKDIDPFLKDLDDVEICDLADAIRSHRASVDAIRSHRTAVDNTKRTPLSILLYNADKDEPYLNIIMRRAIAYRKNNKAGSSNIMGNIMVDVITHLKDKFSRNGYLKYDEYYRKYYGDDTIDELYDNIDNLDIEYYMLQNTYLDKPCNHELGIH